MTSDTKRDSVVLKATAQFEASAAVESRSKLVDEYNSAFRWIVASLFALNGGAILSIFGRGDFGVSTVWPFWSFFSGIVLTFATVVSAQISDRRMIARMHSWGLYWTTVNQTGLRDEEMENSINSGIRAAEGLGRSARLLAFFAMVFFVLGVLAATVLQQKTELERLQGRIDLLEHSNPKPK